MSEYIPSGRNSDAKIIRYRPSDYEGQPLLYVLTQRQTSLLLAITTYLRWVNRYTYQPEDLDTQEKITDYVDRLDNALMVEIEFCAFMIACIENDEDTKNALANLIVQLINENASINQALDNQRQRSDGSYPPYGPNTSGNILDATDCDKDKGAGYIRTGVVDRARALVTAFLADMELATDKNEAIAAWIDAIPIVGELTDLFFIDAIVGAWDNIRDWIKDAWDAEDTDIDRLEETYRDLLCIWESSGCNISLEQIRDYFIKKAFGANPGFADAIGTIVDLVNFLDGSPTSFTGIWYVMMGTIFQAAFVANSFFGLNVPTFKFLASLGDPTDDWIAWEAIYGPCECEVKYHNYLPDTNMPPEFETSVGLIGIQNVMAASGEFDSGTGNTSWVIGTFEVDVTDATACEYVVDEGGRYTAEIYGTSGFFDSVTDFEAVLIGVDRYSIRIEFASPYTGTLNIFNFRREPTGTINDFLWLEFKTFSVC